MRKIFFTLACAAAISAACATAATAQRLTPRERARLEAQVAAGASVTRDLQESAEAYDRAYRAARGIDRTIEAASGRVPGGRLVYRAGRALGNAAVKAEERRR